jgi:hypothetical protein
MPNKPKAPPAPKKVVAKPGTAGLTPDLKVTHARKVKNTCNGNAAYNACQPCKDAMAIWMTKTDNLEKNQKDKATILVQLSNLLAQEGVCVFEYDLAATGFVTAVRTLAGTDPTIVTALGLELRADPIHAADPFTPTGLHLAILKGKKLPKLAWDHMPGAMMYVAQISVQPATDTTWQTVYGNGKTRLLPPLVPGQHYVGRVAAVGKDGKQSTWTTELTFVG